MSPLRRIACWLAGMLALLAAMIGALPAPAAAAPPEAPPDVVGLFGGDAETVLKDWRSDTAVILTPVGGQPPKGGDLRAAFVEKQALAGTGNQPPRIELFVAPRVPNVLALPLADATDLLNRRGFTASLPPAGVAPSGVVLRQSPQPGTRAVPWGGPVTLAVGPSRAQLPVEVPDLAGLTRAEATDLVDRAGLVLRLGRADPPAEPVRVVSQDPAASTRVPRRSTVTALVRGQVEASASATPPRPPPPPPPQVRWQAVALTGGGGLLLLALAGLLLARARVRRPPWVRAHLRVEPRWTAGRAPEFAGQGPAITIEIRLRPSAGTHAYEELS